MIGLCEDLKRRLEHDKKSIELTTTGGRWYLKMFYFPLVVKIKFDV